MSMDQDRLEWDTPALKPDLDRIPPDQRSCSQCQYFTYDPSHMCIINPTLCNARCEFHKPIGIFSCNFMIKCLLFERDYTKRPGYIKN